MGTSPRLFLSVLLLSACGSAENAWTGTVRDSAGIQIVENSGDAVWGEGEAWTFEEVLRIGTVEGEPEYQFGQVAAIAMAPNRDIYVVDAPAMQIKQFDSTGRHIRTFAGSGGGPGQLGPLVPALTILRDTLFVLDQANMRVNRYLLDGSMAGSFRIEFQTGIPLRLQASPWGTLLAQMRRFGFPGVQGDSLDHVVELSGDGTRLDTLFSFPSGQTFSAGDGRPQFRLFSPEPIWAVRDAGGLLFAVNGAYRIEIRDSSGAIQRIFTMPHTGAPVTDDDAERLRTTMPELMNRATPQRPSPDQLDRMREMIQFAENYPAFATLRGGPDNSIWVQQFQRPGEALASDPANLDLSTIPFASRWDVFDAGGRYQGVVEMPEGFTVQGFQADLVFGIWTDELDVPYVVVLRLQHTT